MANVAFIGLGRMGHGMAGRYLDAGFGVAVWNRSKAKAEVNKFLETIHAA